MKPPRWPRADARAILGWLLLWLVATAAWLATSPPALWKELQRSWLQREQAELERLLTAVRDDAAAERAELENAMAEHTRQLAGHREEVERLEQDLTALGRRRRAAELRRQDLEAAIAHRRRRPGKDTAVLEQDLAGLRRELQLARIEIESVAELEEVSRQGLAGLRGDQLAVEERLQQLDAEERRLMHRIAALEKAAPAVRETEVADYPRTVPEGAPRRDRCVSCHLGVERTADESGEEGDATAAFRGHPRLDLFVAADSAHPQQRFGCTVCHGGEGLALDFSRAGHLPSDPLQAEDWTRRWRWRRDHLPPETILDAGRVEARCASCHPHGRIGGAGRLNAGRELVDRLGCGGCHDLAADEIAPGTGPPLDAIAAKARPGWAYRWIAAPRSVDPAARMPHLFALDAAEGETDRRRQQAEIRAMVTWLWQRSRPFDITPAPAGDAAIGADLFAAIGCVGCHPGERASSLTGLSPKLEAGWLYTWLRDPYAYDPETAMPDLRLSRSEAADLTAFLLASPAASDPLPPVDTEIRDQLVLAHLQNETTIEQSLMRLEKMSDEERELYLGERSVERYGCRGCHPIAGLEKPVVSPAPGVGQADAFHPRERSTAASADEYLARAPLPRYDLDAETRERIAVALLAERAPRFASRGQVEDRVIAHGQQLVERHGCRGCHRIDGRDPSVVSWQHPPPDLTGYGARVRPQWLLDYLAEPGAYDLRPWQRVRMPSYRLDFDERSAFAAYFAALAGTSLLVEEPPTAPREVAVGAVAYSILQCSRCHQSASSSGEPSPPTYALARQRLRPRWVVDWILDPRAFAPDTEMPTVLANEARQQTDSFLAVAIAAPMYWQERGRLRQLFASEEAMIDHLSDARRVAEALRAYLWSLAPEERRNR